MTCSICSHEHVKMINSLLLESPHPVRRIALFYDLDASDLQLLVFTASVKFDKGACSMTWTRQTCSTTKIIA